jgi:hypothetical protein
MTYISRKGATAQSVSLQIISFEVTVQLIAMMG